MSALDSYRTRVNGTIGTSVKEYVKDQVRTSLDTFLEKSQYGMDVLIDGIEKRIGIMTGKMTDTRDEVLVLSKPEDLKMGSLFQWEDDFWVVVKREARVIRESFYGTAYRCNVDLKWVDENGKLNSQKAYAKGRGLSTILTERHYTEAPIITREVETPISVITQRNANLKQDMRFLFGGQPYRVTFVDNLSTDGTTILGMYEDLIQDGDDIENNIASYTRYNIELAFEQDVILEVNTPFEVKYTVYNQGVLIDKPVILIGEEEKVKIEGNVVTPLVAEDILITVALEQNELINTAFIIHSGAEWIEDNIFIIGPDKIAWNTEETYQLNTKADAEFVVNFPAKVKGEIEKTNNSVKINIKDKHSGSIDLVIMTDTEIYTKTIEIVTIGGDL